LAAIGTSSRKKSISTHCVVGVVRKRNQNHFRFPRCAIKIFERIQETGRVGHGNGAGVAFGHDDAILMDWVRGVRRSHNVARPDHGEQQVRQRVLGADGGNGFRFRVQFHAVAVLIALHNFLTQPRNASRHGVAVVTRIARRFHHLVHHGPRRGPVGIAHAEVHHILLCRARLCLHLVDDGEHVGRQLLDAIELLLNLDG
jgi:hypothetical protein